MKLRKLCSAMRGFTMVEMLVVMIIMMTLVLIGLPELMKMMARSRLEGVASETSLLLKRARSESVKRGYDTVFEIDPATGELRAFTDVPEFDAGGNRTDDVWHFDPPAMPTPGQDIDELLGSFSLPRNITFAAPGVEDYFDGFSTHPPPANAVGRVAVFVADGSVDEIGGVRFKDPDGNYLELRVEPKATGKIFLRKWDCDLTKWLTRAEKWNWYSERTGC